MNKKLLVTIITLGTIITICIAVLMFYTSVFEKGNNLIVVANRNVITDSDYSDWISNENFKKFQIVDDEILQKENIYSEIKTSKDFELLSLKKISITYDVTVKVQDLDSLEYIEEYKQELQVIFVFKDFQWTVDSVEQGN